MVQAYLYTHPIQKIKSGRILDKKLDPFYYDTIIEGDEETHCHHAQHIYICSECEYTTLSPTNACPHCKASLTKIVDETEHDKDVMP